MISYWQLLTITAIVCLSRADPIPADGNKDQEDATTPTPMRAGVPTSTSCNGASDGIYPDPDNCQNYLYCVHGNPIVHTCHAGLYFDTVSNNCHYPDSATCYTPPAPFCQGKSNGLHGHPSDCTKLYYCHDGVDYIFDCAEGRWFDTTALRCVFPGYVQSTACGS